MITNFNTLVDTTVQQSPKTQLQDVGIQAEYTGQCGPAANVLRIFNRQEEIYKPQDAASTKVDDVEYTVSIASDNAHSYDYTFWGANLAGWMAVISTCSYEGGKVRRGWVRNDMLRIN